MEPIDDKPRNVDDDDALDSLLAQAKWPEPSERSTRRLRVVWAAVSPARASDSRRIFLPISFAAAVVLVAAMLAVVMILRHEPARELSVFAPAPTAPQEAILPPVTAHCSATSTVASVPVTSLLYEPGWREPTVRERLAMYAELRKPRGNALWARTASPPADVTALLKRFSDPRVAVRISAARSLGGIESAETTALLIQQVNRDICRRESLAALMCSRDESAAAFVAAARNSSDLSPIVRSVEFQLKNF